jgi:choline dehydrogenase-like flavoprotein
MLSLDEYVDPKNQGTDGPLAASFSDVYTPFNHSWIAAFNSAGFEDKNDPILGNKMGPFSPPNSLDPESKQRSYSASAYFTPEVETRPNLDLLTETFVIKVLLEKSAADGFHATGVRVKDGKGQVNDIFAEQVILAAGALQSPVILEDSGIGSKAVLERNGTELLIENPGVGENLQDHAFTSVSFQVAKDQISADIVRDPEVAELVTKQYFETKTGPLSGIAFSLAYTPPVDLGGRMLPDDVKSLASEFINLDDPSLAQGVKAQYSHLKSLLEDPAESTCFYGLLLSQMHVKSTSKTSMKEAYSQQLPENFITTMAGLNHPFSRGSVHSDKSRPLVDPAYLSHPLDLEVLGRATQFLEKLVSQDALKGLLNAEVRIPKLAENIADLNIAKQITKDRLWTTYHPCGTAAMLPQELGGVVDSRLIVYGTDNLRVIDASIFPMITLGNIQATVYSVAERACDIIKEDWARGDKTS